MKKKILSSIFSLCLTLFLLLTTLYAWYTSNDTVSTNSVVSQTADVDCGLNLQYFDGSTWTNVKNGNVIAKPYINPGDILFYRLVISSNTEEEKTLNAIFKDVDSKLDQDFVTYNIEKNKVVYLATTPLYSVINYLVETNEGKTLYQITVNNNESSIALVDYKLEDVVNFYFITTNQNASYSTYSSDLSAGIADGSIIALSLDNESLFTAATNSLATYYAYFALELPESVSNYYSFQELTIGSLNISLI